MTTIGLVANVYNEVNALPGWLETHLPFFDDVRVYHAGPGGDLSNDGTIELLEKWNIPIEFGSINDGFGVVRTKAIRMSPCDWVMILDADERFFSTCHQLSCSGRSTPHSEVDSILQTYDFRDLRKLSPNWDNIGRLGAGLEIDVGVTYDQGSRLREIISRDGYDSVIAVRRHWHDFTFKRPTQNWFTDPDWQMRIIRNVSNIYFDPNVRMHERLIGATGQFRADIMYGLFMDHFHFTFKRMEPEQRAHDVSIYDAIHAGQNPPLWGEFKERL